MDGTNRTALISVLVVAITMVAWAASRAEHATPAQPAQAELHETARTLGPEHELLAARQGEFRLTATYWATAGAEPEVSRMTARRSLVLGGRALRLDVGPDAHGFAGTGLEGYDKVANRFWYTWTDTSTTGLSLLHGTIGPDGAGTYRGEMPTPLGPAPLRVEVRIEGSTEIHDYFLPAEEGGEWRMLELRYVGG